MSDGQGDAKTPNPFEAFKGMRDAYLDSWGRAMVDAVNSEGYAQATGTMLDAYLTASAPFRDAIEKAMVSALQQLSMPTRADITGLAERLTNIEMRLDDLDPRIASIERGTERLSDVEASVKGMTAKVDAARQTADRGAADVEQRLEQITSALSDLAKLHDRIAELAQRLTVLDDNIARIEKLASAKNEPATSAKAATPVQEPLIATEPSAANRPAPAPKKSAKRGRK